MTLEEMTASQPCSECVSLPWEPLLPSACPAPTSLVPGPRSPRHTVCSPRGHCAPGGVGGDQGWPSSPPPFPFPWLKARLVLALP